MKNLIIIFCVFLSNFLNAQSVEGSWLSFNDKTGEQDCIIQIFKKTNGKYYGKIVHLTNEKSRQTLCEKCPESYSENEPVLGIELMRNFAKIGKNKWDGKILDPSDGKIYSCQLSLSPDGKKLNVRGYLGIPLLGRTQIWKRK